MSRVVFCAQCRDAAALEWTWARGDEQRVCAVCVAQGINEAFTPLEPMAGTVLLHRLFHGVTPSSACALCYGSAGASA